MPATIVMTLAIEMLASLVATLVVVALNRSHSKLYVRDWIVAVSAATACSAALLLDFLASAAFSSTHPFRFIPTAMAGAASLLAIAFTLAATLRFSGASPAFTGLRGLWAIGGCGAAATLLLAAAPDRTALRHLVQIGMPAVLTMLAAMYAVTLALRMRTKAATSSTTLVVVMTLIALANASVAVVSLLFAFGSAGGTLLLSVAGFRAVVTVVSSLAIVVMALDDERRTAVSAASQVEHLAYHDALTGLPNRSLFFDRLVVALAHAARHQHKLAVIFLDLDRFKLINDSLGHSVGDAVIRSSAERLRKCVRQEDTIARFGGDEFIILVSVISRPEDAGRVAQKVIESIEPPFLAAAREISVSTSVGIAVYPTDGTDAETLVRNADTAMYRAKESGDPYRFYTPAMNARALEMLEIESDLRRALTRNEFLLHYQPLVDLASGKVFGLEALLRWNHPRLGLLAPDRFMTTAESTGLIIPIGTWVLREACRQLKLWQRSVGTDLIVSVNLSPRQFEQPDLTGKVKAALDEAGLRPKHLELEITESKAMQDVEKTIRILRELKNLGVRISIDDFGTGYSSLSYLKQFPVDTLKLDQSFVREITVPEDGAIASGVIAMAHSLSLKVLAEGVETLGQLEFLKNHSCDRLQGFLFSRPLEPANFERFLAHNGRAVRVA
jgi:diguanylate cyclase (GGDEF)-like protein